MKLLFTVCARAGSKGVKNKNIKNFLGEPLVYYTLSAIDLFMRKYKGEFSNVDVAINTDSRELIQLVGNTTIQYHYIERKVELGLDTSSKIDVIKDTLKKSESIRKVQYDYVIDLDLTSPLRTVNNIYALMNTVIANKSLDVVFSVTGARRNPYFNMVMKNGEDYKRVNDSVFVARQQAPEVYDMNASMYIYKADFLRDSEGKGIFDGKIGVIQMKDTGVLDIDNEEDFELMEVIAPYFFNKYSEYGEVSRNIEKIKRG